MSARATGGLKHGCYFTITPDLVTIKTARETALTLTAKRRGRLALCLLPGGALDTITATDHGALARWAVRLAVELGQAVTLEVHGE